MVIGRYQFIKRKFRNTLTWETSVIYIYACCAVLTDGARKIISRHNARRCF